jgi:hypothetical protein
MNENLNTGSFMLNGDSYEKIFGNLLSDSFPNCEKYWKVFIVPLTNRFLGYPKALEEDIHFRKNIDPNLEDISLIHYSIFFNLVYAHYHLSNPILSSLENFYVHLSSVYDLVDAFLEKNYVLILNCRGEKSELLQTLSKDDFLEMATKWYDDQYAKVYENYLSRGKFMSMKLPSRQLLVKEFIADYLSQENLWNEYKNHSNSIKEFRNVIVHDVQIGKVVIDGKIFIPKPICIQKYRTLRNIQKALENQQTLQNDFVEVLYQFKNDLENTQIILNNLWNVLIPELNIELFHNERKYLHDAYNLNSYV